MKCSQLCSYVRFSRNKVRTNNSTSLKYNEIFEPLVSVDKVLMSQLLYSRV